MPESSSRSLKYRALVLLNESPLADREIAKAIGISAPWIRLFKNGDIKAPNVDTVQRLYEYLSGKPLFSSEG